MRLPFATVTDDREPEPASTAEPPKTEAPLAPGASLGELVILRVLGEGGMGIVFAAYDPRLDRQVAVKLLRTGEVRDKEQARARMLREAQAMARLSHPNVLPVYEVGTHEGEIYLVMEFVDGQSLEEWLKEERPYREVLACLRDAGRGLAAAHKASLVHRDFKPDNVLIGKDGRPRVADFGIAGRHGTEERAGQSSPPEPLSAEAEALLAQLRETESAPLSQALTRTGARIGTPAYMAPEQLFGQKADPRADQFAFCLVLWEALYGQRPYGEGPSGHIAGLLEKEAIREPPASEVPPRVRAALERGLAHAPEERFATMEALLGALEEPEPTRSNRLLLLGLGGLLALALAMLGVGLWLRPEPDPCPPPDLRGTWDGPLREAIRARFLATEAPFAEASLRPTLELLDSYAESWSAAHVEACRATAVRHEQSQRLLDLRMRCLTQGRQDLGALVRTLGEADRAMIQRSLRAVSDLPSLDRCSNADSLLLAPPLPREPERRAEIESLRAALSSARANNWAGRITEAIRQLERLQSRVEEASYAPLTAEVALLRASIQITLGEPEAALRSLEQTMQAAAHARQDELLLEAAGRRSALMAASLGRTEEALAQAPLLMALAARSSSRLLRAQVWGHLALAQHFAGDDRAAVRLERRSVRGHVAVNGEDHLFTLIARGNLAAFLKDNGELREAMREYARITEGAERLLGAEHPRLTYSMSGLGVCERLVGELERSEATLRRTLAVQERSFGEESADAGDTRWYLALTLMDLRRVQEAEEEAARSVAILSRRDSADLARALAARARVRAASGNAQGAEEDLERARVIFLRELGETHIETAKIQEQLARVALSRGHLRQARASLMPALAILRRTRSIPRWRYQAELTEAELQLAEGDAGGATRSVQRIIEQAGRRLGGERLIVLRARVALAELALGEGRIEAARAEAERVLAELGDRDQGLHARALLILANTEPGSSESARPRVEEALRELSTGHAQDRHEASELLRAALRRFSMEAPAWLRASM